MKTERQKEAAYEEMITTMSDKRRLVSIEHRLRALETRVSRLENGPSKEEIIKIMREMKRVDMHHVMAGV